VKLIPRKLLAAAAPITLAAALSACGASAPASARAATYPAPVTATVATDPAPAPAPVIENVVATPEVAPVTDYATPMVDENGRPLAGNVRGKNGQ
jgi:hypothetical protein